MCLAAVLVAVAAGVGSARDLAGRRAWKRDSLGAAVGARISIKWRRGPASGGPGKWQRGRASESGEAGVKSRGTGRVGDGRRREEV